jgi:hypothetical protein
MDGDTHDLARLEASRLLLQRQSSEQHGLLILLELDGRQDTLLGSPAVCLFLAVCKVEVDAVAAAATFKKLRSCDRADTGGILTYYYRHETNLQAVQVFLPGLRFCKCPD